MKKSNMRFVRYGSLTAAVLLWQLFAYLNKQAEWINANFLPTPLDVLINIVESFASGDLLPHLLASIERVLIGFAIGTTLAVVLGYFMAKSRLFENILQPLFNAVGAVPAYAFMPLFVIWFGIGELPKYILIVYTTFLPMLTYVIQGIKSIDPLLVRSASSLGASQKQIFFNVVIKSTMPHLFAGMKVSLGLCYSALVVAEMMGADVGLGYLIVNAKNYFRVDDMFMAIVLIAILYSVMMAILSFIEKKLCKWKIRDFASAIE